VKNRTIEHSERDERIEFVETSEETGGSRTLVIVDLGPGGVAPAHRHKTQAERFVCVSGVLDVSLDGKTRKLTAGEEVTAPSGMMHAFGNTGSERAVFRVEITPGNPGWEKMMRVSFGLVNDGETWGDIPKRFTDLAVLATWGEADLPGPLVLFAPLFRWRAASEAGIRRGAELLRRYGG